MTAATEETIVPPAPAARRAPPVKGNTGSAQRKPKAAPKRAAPATPDRQPRPARAIEGPADETSADEGDDRRHAPVHRTHASVSHGKKVHPTADQPWARTEKLDAPPPRPGFKQRWVRVSSRGQDDPVNASRKEREGWLPRRADTVPAEYRVPTISRGQFAGCIGQGGLVLCEMPIERVKRRNAFFRAKADAMTSAIDQRLRDAQTPGGPEIVKKHTTTVTVGRPRRPAVRPNEGDDGDEE